MGGGGYLGAIFDVDGVLVDSPHERAWREALRLLMEGEWAGVRGGTRWSAEGFTGRVYQEVLSGKPRIRGARDCLAYFGVPDVEGRAEVFAECKQRLLARFAEAGEFSAYPDAVRFVLAVREAGIATAVASSSRNAGFFLRRIGVGGSAGEGGGSSAVVLLDCFDVDVSGRWAGPGKPDPGIFLMAAEELQVAPGDCFVVEDAVSGVRAAKNGGLAALGVARAGERELLEAAGADLVVATLDEVDVAVLPVHRLTSRE
ncbi:beta-phosphoglucomutase family hydrolase [Sphaerisporangium rubeum]|uniref:Beta-phosphoglucomutase-like phosphatase (HAD superfamily) n=1 Tax=Sphaerisporangium rubeum TaxID=321317 RepID=A0A7X0M8T4_9ACTN|nr:HAD-IA family hydrolase [Sphaerisporangium rubeum]MBB6475727.1 beta-phosphoglucomutase-like phosphatase (HAD superfamily) [Sphaerisporangium rubeum]